MNLSSLSASHQPHMNTNLPSLDRKLASALAKAICEPLESSGIADDRLLEVADRIGSAVALAISTDLHFESELRGAIRVQIDPPIEG